MWRWGKKKKNEMRGEEKNLGGVGGKKLGDKEDKRLKGGGGRGKGKTPRDEQPLK